MILTEFPAFTTMKLFILRLVNLGLTGTWKKNDRRCNRVISQYGKEMISGACLKYLTKVHTE